MSYYSEAEYQLERAAYIADGEAQFWHDVLSPTPPATPEARIAEYEAARHRRLLARAQALRLAYDRDYLSTDGMIVWQPDQRGRCEVVEPDRCSCREYRLLGACPHHALFLEARKECRS